jgi:hypothetical protein
MQDGGYYWRTSKRLEKGLGEIPFYDGDEYEDQ